MDAIKLLEWQHDEVDTLFAQYDEAEDSDEKLEAFNELADILMAHAAIEEKLFYPAVYVGELREQLTEAVEEHLRAKRLISDLQDLEPSDAKFDSKMKLLREEVEQHVTDEEEELFPIVKQTLPSIELEALGESMEELYEDLMDGNLSDDDVEEEDEVASLR
jgi:hemerythrin superfamily protein